MRPVGPAQQLPAAQRVDAGEGAWGSLRTAWLSDESQGSLCKLLEG